MTPSDDIFVLLRLPLDCDDPALIRSAIARTREACSRGTMMGTDKLACEALLARLPELERVLLDPAARWEAREAAREARASAREARLAAFRRDLAMLLSGGRGSLTTAERDRLLSAHSDPGGPSPAELRALITVPVVADARQASAQAIPLPAHEARDIAGKLAVLGKRDLYDFLEVAPTAASREIEAHQRELAASWALKAKATPEKSAAQALLGRVTVVLLAPQKRASYDATLRETRLQPLLGSIALALADGRLSAHEHAHLLAQARDLGITADDAEAAILAASAAAGAVVEAPAGGAAVPAQETDGRWRPLEDEALVLLGRGDHDGAMPLFKEQERICREIGERDGLQFSLRNQGWILLGRGDHDGAMPLFKEQERICREIGERFGLQFSLGNQGWILLNVRGDNDGAMPLFKEQERICRESGERADQANSLANQGSILFQRGDYDGAMPLFKEAERICREIGERADLQFSLGKQGYILLQRGDHDGAMPLFKEQERICRESGDEVNLANSLANQAWILQAHA